METDSVILNGIAALATGRSQGIGRVTVLVNNAE